MDEINEKRKHGVRERETETEGKGVQGDSEHKTQCTLFATLHPHPPTHANTYTRTQSKATRSQPQDASYLYPS